MNRYLQDILEQPTILQTVLDYSIGPGWDTLRDAAAAIANAPRLVITSMGSALYSCMPMYHALSRCHANVHLAETAELLVHAPYLEDTVYVIMSRSGESGEIARFAQEVRGGGGKLVAITMTPDSTLAHQADFFVHDVATYDGLICTKAYTSMILVGLLVAAASAGTLCETLIADLHRQFAWMEENKEALLRRIQAIDALAAKANVVYFLSQGAGMAVAASGALLMEEAARLPASVYSFGMFHHGPLELVDENFTGFWIDLAPDERTRELYAEILGKGGAVISVSPDAETYPEGFAMPSTPLPESYRTLSAAMVVQMAAYHAAKDRGLEPGEMRYLNWLVK